jgi:translation initiation factor 1
MLDISKLFNGRNLTENNIQKSPKQKQISTSPILSPEKHLLHFRKEKRRSKIVTMVGFFQLSEIDKKQLLQSIKKSVSTGGTVRDEYLEFQGDIQKKLKDEFIQRGFKFKK